MGWIASTCFKSAVVTAMSRMDMPLRCPCGSDNPDESVYCNKCGMRLLSSSQAQKTCSVCQHENPPHVEYCGYCGSVLAGQSAKSVTSGDPLPSLMRPDTYTVGWYPLSSGLLYSTKGQFIIGLILLIPIIVMFFLLFTIGEGLLCGVAWCILAAAITYISWRVRRDLAGA